MAIPDELFTFLAELKDNNDREWFQANNVARNCRAGVPAPEIRRQARVPGLWRRGKPPRQSCRRRSELEEDAAKEALKTQRERKR